MHGPGMGGSTDSVPAPVGGGWSFDRGEDRASLGDLLRFEDHRSFHLAGLTVQFHGSL